MIFIALCIIEHKDGSSIHTQVRCDAPGTPEAIKHIAGYNPDLTWWNKEHTVRVTQISTVEKIRDAGTIEVSRRRRRHA